jgi:hypothetical protein
MARPRYHLLATAPLAWALYRRLGMAAAAGAVASGVLIDADHLVDYLWTRWRQQKSHYFAPLHAWELATAALVLAALAWQAGADGKPRAAAVQGRRRRPARYLPVRRARALLTGLAAGWWLHLVQDVLTNRPEHWGTYTLFFRASRGFARHATGWASHRSFHDWSHRPWYEWF